MLVAGVIICIYTLQNHITTVNICFVFAAKDNNDELTVIGNRLFLFVHVKYSNTVTVWYYYPLC